jgi:hypothetical protein
VENFGEIRANTGTLQFTEVLDLNAGSTITGAAPVRFSGNVTMNAPVSNGGDIIFDGGTLNAAVTTNGVPLSSYSGAGSFNWTGGTMAGRFVLSPGNTISITGSNTKTFDSAAVFDNYGTVNWSGPGTLYNYGYFGGTQATFNNHSNAAFNLLTDGTVFSHQFSPSYFTNFSGAAFVKVNGAGTNLIDSFNFENSGEIRAQVGSIQFNETVDLFNGSLITGTGVTRSAGNTVLHGGMNINGSPLQLVNGTFTGDTGTLAAISSANGGVFEWWNGQLNGTVRVNAATALQMISGGTKTFGDGAILNNGGTVTWTAGSIYNYAYYGGQEATINNLNGGLFDIAGDVSFTHQYTPSTFNNNPGAILRKSAGTTANCDWIVNNNGAFDLRTGNFVNNALTLGTNGNVSISLTDTNAAAKLTENGALTFAGGLTLLTNGITFTNGLAFTLANYSSQTGAFSSVALPSLPPRWRWKLNYGPTSLTAAIVESTILNAPVKAGNGALQLSLNGEPASAAVLQTSLDLAAWTSIYTNAPFTGAFDFSDTPSAGETNKFYRILIVP